MPYITLLNFIRNLWLTVKAFLIYPFRGAPKLRCNIIDLINFNRFALLALSNSIPILPIITYGGAFVEDETTASVLFTIFSERYGGGHGANLLDNPVLMERRSEIDEIARETFLKHYIYIEERIRVDESEWLTRRNYRYHFEDILHRRSCMLERYMIDHYRYGSITCANTNKRQILEFQLRFVNESFRRTHGCRFTTGFF